jgi:hypothetical protein
MTTDILQSLALMALSIGLVIQGIALLLHVLNHH